MTLYKINLYFHSSIGVLKFNTTLRSKQKKTLIKLFNIEESSYDYAFGSLLNVMLSLVTLTFLHINLTHVSNLYSKVASVA